MKDEFKTNYRTLLKAKTLLERSGYLVILSKTAGVIFDLVALNEREIRVVAIKSADFDNLRDFKNEREEIAITILPRNVQKELWVWEHRLGFHYFTIGNRS